ncbi:hypothetical protein [Pedobacter ureilyticus]|uniref:DUF8202 domain-containing protein n=1 Tax=Pedobacter ureilyticus TaxID=1393051 RepID=A0ABW9J4G6_9SPHI|nr:hypothetical protein [Pedobacter helvus]
MKSFTSFKLLKFRTNTTAPKRLGSGIRSFIFNTYFFLLIGLGLSANAQNLISNAGFETYTQLPTLNGQLPRATGWLNSLGPTAGSPDYWNTLGTVNISSKIGPYSGTGYAGTFLEAFDSATTNLTDYKEYMTVQLSSPLQAGKTYRISFYTAHMYGTAPSNITFSSMTFDDLPSSEQGYLGVVFSAAAPVAANTVGNTNPRWTSLRNDFGVGRVLIPSTNTNVYGAASRNAWVKVDLLYTATGTEQYMTVGQLRPGATSLPDKVGAYYTYDEFSLTPVPTPGGVSAPDFWVKSDDAGTIATAWKDHSLNADNIPNVGTMTLSAADRAHNFHPYTTGYSGSKYFNNPTSVLNPTNGLLSNVSHSIFSAIRPTSSGTGRITGIDDDGNGAEPGFSIETGKLRFYKFSGDANADQFDERPFNIGSTNIVSGIGNNPVAAGGTSTSAGGERVLGMNGVYKTYPSTASSNRFHLYGQRLRIGQGTWSAAGPFPGDIMEVIWYKRPLTANEQSRVNTYLAVKNGVTLEENYLTSNSTIVWDLIVNSGYNNNIFGIARDDISGLSQKQSGSVNNSQKLVIATTGFANDNAANSTGLTTDQQYLMTGDNGLKQSLTTPLVFTGGTNGPTNLRFESIWKIQNTGTVGTVTVAWPKGVKNLYLVQSTDAAFDDTDTFTPMATEVTINGVVYNTANVTLANGWFFTFAGLGNSPGGVVNGLSYWYRADKNAVNTGAATDVTGWTDVWSGTTVAQLGTNTLPKYVLGAANYFNFNAGINFTAGTQTLGNNTVRTLTSLDYDVFTLTKEGLVSGGSFGRLFSVGMDNTTTGIANWDAFGIWAGTTELERRVYGGGTQYPTVPPAYSTTIPSIMYFRNTNVNSAKGLNGASMNTAVTYSAINAQFGGHIFGSTVFSSNGSDNPGFLGHIGETIVYGAGTLTTTERRRVDSYLAIKYGITLGQVNTEHYLDADAATVWNGASNTAYNNNIFGVAREDIGLFEQKVSKSVNAGTILTVATTNDFVNPNDNAARTGFTNDKTYFLLGDNNVTATPLVNVTVAGNTWKRIQRIWLSQRKNTPNVLNFEADLSTYGGYFGASFPVSMLIADDAAFTTNVKSVAGTYTAGKWVFSNNFNTENAQRYITFATLPPNYCVTGDCNPNTFLNTSDPNTIEYDNMVSVFHGTIMRDANTGALMAWGEGMANNGTAHLLSPTAINSTNYPALTGAILKFASGSYEVRGHQSFVLTTDGLFTWGEPGTVISASLTSSSTFQKVSIGTFGVNGGATKADGLPDGVAPTDVKMLFGTYRALALVTCSGEAWVLSSIGNLYGDDAPDNAANDMLWHRVSINATTALYNVVALRGAGSQALMALTSTGEVYTWGTNTRLGNNTAAAARAFATQMTLPSGVTPKMIGATGSANTTYYVLGTNGNVYSMGENSVRQLGNFNTTSSNVWVQVQKSSTSGDYLTNVVWISPNEHDYYQFGTTNSGSINVLTADGRLWAWGFTNVYMLGESGVSMNPTQMPGSIPSTDPYDIGKLNWTDKVIAVETGGHTSMTVKDNTKRYGYVGHRVNGSMGDGNSISATEDEYNFAGTPEINLCGAPTGSCTNPGVFDAAGLPSTTGISNLVGFTGGTTGWPANVNNGHIVIESKNKGFVITRVSSSAAILNPVEGMLIYDIAAACVKLYNGTVWKCLAKDCL